MEIIDGKFTGVFFRSFLGNKNEENKEKMLTFFNFIKRAIIISHNTDFNVKFINKELLGNSL